MPEKTTSSPSAGGRVLLAVALMLVILLPVVYSVITRVTATGAEPPQAPKEMSWEGETVEVTECIRDTEYMRFHHWELLKGMREKVVRDGIRGDLVPVEVVSEGETKVVEVEQSLDGCWNCHQSKEHFCDRCHHAANVLPDCFGCHYYPDVDGY